MFDYTLDKFFMNKENPKSCHWRPGLCFLLKKHWCGFGCEFKYGYYSRGIVQNFKNVHVFRRSCPCIHVWFTLDKGVCSGVSVYFIIWVGYIQKISPSFLCIWRVLKVSVSYINVWLYIRCGRLKRNKSEEHI